MSEGVIELVLEDKGEGASFTDVTPEEFYNFSFELSWAGYAAIGTAAVAGGVIGFVAGPFLFTAFAAWGTLSALATAAAGTAGVVVVGGTLTAGTAGVVSLINYMSDALENLIEFKPEDYSYFINRYRQFEEDRRQGIATALLVKIKKKLIDKETITDDEKRFYKAFKDLVQFEDKNSDFYKLMKTLVIIVDWLFVLNGVTDVQSGSSVLLERYSKANMISDISKKVDAMFKAGFDLRDSSPPRNGFYFKYLPVPYVGQRGTVDSFQAFIYPKIYGNSKIASDNLEEAAKAIAENIAVLENSSTPGIKKYAALIGGDLINNIMKTPSGVFADTFTFSADQYGYERADYKYQYNGEDVHPDKDGWEDESKFSSAEKRKAIAALGASTIKIDKGLNATSVVSFADTFEPQNNARITGLTSVPQPGAKVGEVVQSLVDAGYAFFIAELGQSALNNANINQKTLYDEAVYYYSEIIARVIGTVVNSVGKFYLYAEFSALFAQGKDIDDEAIVAAQLAANAATNEAANNIATGGGLDSSLEITDEQLKNRQKFVKQCILMYNLDTLKTEYRNYIKYQPFADPNHKIHGISPFAGRFHAIEDTDSLNTNTINKMVCSKGKDMKPLLEITPDIHAFLVPKIRIYRVVHAIDGKGGLIETEFNFSKKMNKKRVEELLSAEYDKGGEYGIKSFDFSFEGTNPATARNDITAKLSLYFQSFQDFVAERYSPDGVKYRFVDLIIFPVNKKNRIGTGTLRAEEYDPSYYRLRAEVGWMVPENHAGLDEVLQKRGFSYDELKKSLFLTNKSFYLNMVDHEMSIKDDGTVDINISYRAYIESALKSTKFDALTTPQLRKNRQKFKEAMVVALEKNNCSNEEIKTIKELFRKSEEETVKKVYRSLLTRLNKTSSVFFVDVNVVDIKQFRRDGFFSRGLAPRLETAAEDILKQNTVIEDMSNKAEDKTEETTDGTTLRLLQDGVKDYPSEDMKVDNRINFFYLGDLIYTMMDNMYDENGNQNIDMNKTKLLLSSFGTFGAFGEADTSQHKSFNIIDIPISVEYFVEWFTQNVIKPKRLYYPLMDFVRDLTNNLVVNLLMDSCADRPIDTKMRFNTANFVFMGSGDDANTDPFMDFKSKANFPIIDLADYYGNGLPLLSDKEGEKNIEDFYNYIAIYPITTTVVHPGNGKRYEDEEKGIYHFQIGSDKGLLKKITFSKSDTQYLRESRFLRNGVDGLMQLSAVYKASLKMVGNTIYYPGMDLFIDPVGIGGPKFKPSDKDSLAYKTGIGGYHLVTRVNSTIAPGKFETTVEATWHNSGAGTGRFANRPGMDAQPDTEGRESITSQPKVSDDGTIDTTTKCTPLVSSFEDYLANVQNSNEGVDFNPDLSSFQDSNTANQQNTQQSFPEETVDEFGFPLESFPNGEEPI